jgi:hypothetical protein
VLSWRHGGNTRGAGLGPSARALGDAECKPDECSTLGDSKGTCIFAGASSVRSTRANHSRNEGRARSDAESVSIMRLIRANVLLGLAFVALWSCSESDPENIESPDGSAAVATGDGGTCPANLPAADTNCTRIGLVCEYGDEPRHWCRPSATCSASVGDRSTWQLSQDNCPARPESECPASRSSAGGTSCSAEGAWCLYGAGLSCECTNCLWAGGPRCTGALAWHCQQPNSYQGCPAALPLLGSPCDSSALCGYAGLGNLGGPGCGRALVRCIDGLWFGAEEDPCPM